METTTEDRLEAIASSLAQAQAQVARARRVRDELGADPSNVLHVVRRTAARAVATVQEELAELARGRASL